MLDIIKELGKVVVTFKPIPEQASCHVEITSGIKVRVRPDRYGVRYFSQVTGYDEESITLDCPELKRQSSKLVGFTVEVNFNHDNRALYFVEKTLGRDTDGNVKVKNPFEISETMRRKAQRLFIKRPLKLYSIDGEKVTIDHTAQIKDISVTGLRFECDASGVQGFGISKTEKQYMDPSSLVYVEFAMPGAIKTSSVRSETTWITRVGAMNEVGINFQNLSARDRLVIAQHINEANLKEIQTEEEAEEEKNIF